MNGIPPPIESERSRSPVNDDADFLENNSFKDGFFDLLLRDLTFSEPIPELPLLAEPRGEGEGDGESFSFLEADGWADEKFGSDNIGIERLFSDAAAPPGRCCEGGGVEVGN